MTTSAPAAPDPVVLDLDAMIADLRVMLGFAAEAEQAKARAERAELALAEIRDALDRRAQAAHTAWRQADANGSRYAASKRRARYHEAVGCAAVAERIAPRES